MEINSNKNQLTPQSDEEKKILKELVSKGILKATTKSERAFTIDVDLETIFKENNYDCLECAEKVMRKITGKVPEEVDGAVSHTVIGRFPIGSTDQKNIESVISSHKLENQNQCFPSPNQAYFACVVAGQEGKTLSPYHAAAVIFECGSWNYTLECWSGNKWSFKSYQKTQNDFHSHYYDTYFKKYNVEVYTLSIELNVQ